MAQHNHEAVARAIRHKQQIQARRGLLNFTSYTFPEYKVAWYHRFLANRLTHFAHGKIKRLIIQMPPRRGKALALDTPVPTPNGWATISSLRVGDEVFDGSGNICKVVAKSPVWKNRNCYKVLTDDRDTIIADEEHEWYVSLDRHKARVNSKGQNIKAASDKIHTTKVLAKKRGKRARVLINKPLNLPEKYLPIEPYTLGVWLGDGCSHHATISCHDDDAPYIKKFIHEDGFEISERKTKQTFGVSGLLVKLKAEGLLKNKHIPKEYLRGSIRQRMALLQGLIDTDGYVSPEDGKIEFTTIQKSLAEDVAELIWSLGCKVFINEGKATLYGRYISDKYRVCFYMKGAARLPRKAERCRDAIKTHNRYLEAEICDSVPTQCIQVDSESHLFLAGKSMTPTHNSELMSRRLPAFIFGMNPDARIIACSHTASLASSMNRDVQRIIETAQYQEIFPDISLGNENIRTSLSRALRNNDEFEVVGSDGKVHGYYRCAGVNTKIAGRGFEYGLIDDFVGDNVGAESLTVRNSTWDWFTGDFYTRRAPEACIAVCGTRRHEDDLIGRLLKLAREDKNADQWEVITFPEINDYQDLGEMQPGYDVREPGEVLWPEMFSLQEAITTKSTLGNYQFSSLFQQRPTAREGNAIKWEWFEPYINFFDESAIESMVLYFDLGASDSKNADSTVGTVGIKMRTGETIMLWQHGGQWSPFKRNKIIEQMCLVWDNIFPGIPIFIEGGIGLGVQATNELHNDLLSKGLNVRIDRVRQSKYIRATAQSQSFFAAAEAKRIKIYAGNLYAQRLASFRDEEESHLQWIYEQKDEFSRLQFKPSANGIEFVGGHDDRLDSAVGCYNKLTAHVDWSIEVINF